MPKDSIRVFTNQQEMFVISMVLTTFSHFRAQKREDLSILHPLPRVNEISVAIDDDPRACYFKQVFNGKIVRMALIMKLLEVSV